MSSATYTNVDMRPRDVRTIVTELHVWATTFGLAADDGRSGLYRPIQQLIDSCINIFPPTAFLLFTARRYASAVLAVIVCPSVRPSVTSRSCTKMAKPRIRLTTAYDSPEPLVLRCQKSWRHSYDITRTGAPKRGGVGS